MSNYFRLPSKYHNVYVNFRALRAPIFSVWFHVTLKITLNCILFTIRTSSASFFVSWPAAAVKTTTQTTKEKTTERTDHVMFGMMYAFISGYITHTEESARAREKIAQIEINNNWNFPIWLPHSARTPNEQKIAVSKLIKRQFSESSSWPPKMRIENEMESNAGIKKQIMYHACMCSHTDDHYLPWMSQHVYGWLNSIPNKFGYLVFRVFPSDLVLRLRVRTLIESGILDETSCASHFRRIYINARNSSAHLPWQCVYWSRGRKLLLKGL